MGVIVRNYDFTRDGGAVGESVDLGTQDPRVNGALPQGSALIGGYVQVLEAVLPATATNTISVQAIGDIIALGTTLNSTGLKDIVPQDFDIGTAVVVTGTESFVSIDFTGSSPTQGVVQAVFTYFLTVPE